MAKLSDKKKHKTANSSNKVGMDINIVDYFSARYTIQKSWWAKQLGMTKQAFAYALERGLHPEEVEILENAIYEMAKELSDFKMPSYMEYSSKHKHKEAA